MAALLRLRTHIRPCARNGRREPIKSRKDNFDEVRRGRRDYEMRRDTRRRKMIQGRGADLKSYAKEAVEAELLLEFRQSVFRDLAIVEEQLADTDTLKKSPAAKIEKLRKEKAKIENILIDDAEKPTRLAPVFGPEHGQQEARRVTRAELEDLRCS
jgi:hypothetical protein